MADPLAPHDIARRTFGVARRGYEQQEVRGFLHEVSALVERLTRAEKELRERAERAEARLEMVQQPDEAMLLEVLGEETTRVLTSARESAAEIRAKAEESAARLIADATNEATETRGSAARDADALLSDARAEADALLEQARTELDRRSAEAEVAAAAIQAEGETAAEALREEARAELASAQADSESTREASRQEGRRLVLEAQVVRERVLRDLAARRKRSRQQVEKLNAGRERLLAAYDVVRRTIDEATTELSVSLTDARQAADAAARRIDEEPEPTLEELDEEVARAGVDVSVADTEGPELDGAPDDTGSTDAAEASHEERGEPAGPFSGEVPAVEAEAPPADAEALEAPAEGRRVIEVDHGRGRKRRKKGFEGLPPAELEVVEPPAAEEGVRVLPDEAGAPTEAAAATSDAAPAAEQLAEEASPSGEPEPAAPVEPGAGGEDDEAASRSTEELFARLRAEREAGEAAPAVEEPEAGDSDAGAEAPTEDAAAEAAADEEPAVPTDEAARPFAARAAALASVERDLARRLKRGLADEQNEVLDLLRRAKPNGVDDVLPAADEHAARWAELVTAPLGDAAAAGADWSGGKPSAVAPLAAELAEGLTAPLRERIDRSFAASDGNLDDVADRVRALYREWKGTRLTEACAHFAATAYGRGLFDGIPSGAKVHWVVDPGAGACPDCDDNVLAGAIAKGEDFPTGNPCAPAHPGCHCLVLAVDG